MEDIGILRGLRTYEPALTVTVGTERVNRGTRALRPHRSVPLVTLSAEIDSRGMCGLDFEKQFELTRPHSCCRLRTDRDLKVDRTWSRRAVRAHERTTNTTYRCWLIGGLVTCMVEHRAPTLDDQAKADVDSSGCSDLRDIQPLSRTCRLPLQPAWDLIWSLQDACVNLIRCSPASLWGEKDV